MQVYVHLISGVMRCLDTDKAVGAETLERLEQARQTLALAGRSAFVERAIGQLRWRRQVLDAYWDHLARGDYRSAHRIFHDELLPTLGESLPPAIRLGLVLADRGIGVVPTGELLQRLDALQRENSELDAGLVAKVRRYLLDGDRLLELAQAVRTRRPSPSAEPVADRSLRRPGAAGRDRPGGLDGGPRSARGTAAPVRGGTRPAKPAGAGGFAPGSPLRIPADVGVGGAWRCGGSSRFAASTS